MSMYKNLMTVCAAATLALGLAACGGGGGDDDDQMTMAPEMCPEGQTGTPPNCMTPEPPGPTDEEIAATTKAAKTKLDAIVAEAALTADSGLGGSSVTATGNDAGAYNVSVERDRDGTTVTVTVEGATDAADEDFEMAEDLGGGLTMHTRDGEMGMQEIAMVMTDIEAPKAVAFVKWEGRQADGVTPTMPQVLNVNSDTGIAATGDETDDALDIPADTTLTGAANMNLMFARSTTNGELNYSRDNPGTDPTPSVDEGLHDGTYNGAEGTFRCTATTGECTVTFNAKGQVVGNSAGWVFIPDEGATSDQPDYDYLNYGFWLKKTTEDGVTEYDEVAFFHGAVGMANSAGTVTGTASYEGSAVGVYVHNVLSEGGGKVESRTAGHFTADANLMAYFGQPAAPNDNIPPNKLDTLTGTINNFELSGGEDQDWSVALKGSIDGSTGTGGSTYAITGTANGGGAEGSLTGQFYGASGETPGAATGEFDANFSNGSVAGAFGVREKK